jgi:hypothetical protein
MKKTFILTQFGTPFEWTEKFIDSVQHLEKYGWYWKVFTPNDIKSRGNVEIVPMTTNQFNSLVEKKLGVRPNMFMTELGVPSVHVTDFLVAWGVILEDYLKDSDFWGACGWDMVFGRLDHFLPDGYLEGCDIFTDDINIINGCFVLFRNKPEINNLFKKILDWEAKLAQAPCQRCLGNPEAWQHTLHGTDEYGLTEVMKDLTVLAKTRYLYPKYYPLHSHDRLEHQIKPKLKIQEDGSLWELLEDVKPPNWIHARQFFGREIMYFHFMKTKAWPIKEL